MKSFLQYIFARNWPLKIYLLGAASAGLCFAVSSCQPSVMTFHDWGYLLLFVISVIIAPVLFVFLCLPVAFIVLAPLFRLASKLNEAPFHVGDQVRILAGPNRNRVVRVYEIWEEHGRVRVELDGQTGANVKDVFSFTQVARAN